MNGPLFGFQDHNGKRLKCVALHDAYPRKSVEVMTVLNILYAPIVRLERDEGVHQAEADVDQIRIRCNVFSTILIFLSQGAKYHLLGC